MERKKKAYKVLLLVLVVVLSAAALTACTDGNNVFSIAETGSSAYDIAVKNGFEGTEQQWLDSLKGEAVYTDSAYDLAVEYGFDGTEEEWLASLKGDTGVAGGGTVSEAVNKSILSVVTINAYFVTTVKSYDRYGRVIGSEDKTYGSAGSGVIIDDDKTDGVAYIVTNYHVVYDVNSNTSDNISNEIYVYLYGMELAKYKISATYIGGSMSYDLAVLKIDSDIYANSNAKPAVIGKSGDMSVGDTVLAIGNPEADGIAVTAGILSLESEYIQMTGADDVTQMTFRVMRIDAAINGGNSGGGLFNANGELVGIVNAKIVSNEIEGMAYAIPVDLANAVVTNIRANCDGTTNKQIKRYLMGITVAVTDSFTEIDETSGKVSVKNVVSVADIEAGSAAASAGLAKGDEINYIRYKSKLYSVVREYDITNLSLLFAEGDEIFVGITRDGVSQEIGMTLTEATVVK